MLAKQHKVNRKAFETVFKKGSAFHSSHFSLRVVTQTGARTYAAAFVVPKKVEKGAVARNRMRRRCYYAIRSVSGAFVKQFTAVFVVKKTLRSLPLAALREEVTLLLGKAGVM